MRGSPLSCVLAIALCTVPLSAAQLSASTILNQVAQRYRSLKSFRLEAVEHSELDWNGRKYGNFTRPMTISVLEPDKMQRDYHDGWGMTLLSGRLEWQVVGPLHQYTSHPVRSPDPWREEYQDWRLIQKDLASAQRLPDQTVTVNGAATACYVTRAAYLRPPLFPKNAITFWIDKQEMIPVRVVSEQEAIINDKLKPGASDRRELVVHSFELNPTLPPNTFTFAPPPGSELVKTFERRNATPAEAPDFTLPDLQGNQVSLSEFRGRRVLLYFWATWCIPCRAETPIVMKLRKEYAPKGVAFFAITDDQPDTIRRYYTKTGDTLACLVDKNHSVISRYHAQAIPSIVLINPSGRVQWSAINPSEQEIRAALERSLR